MTVEQLKAKLDYVNKSRENRQLYAQMILDRPDFVPILLKIAMQKDDALSNRAAWILEFACSKNLSILSPHLDFFTEHLNQPNNDSTIRPIAKVCELLVETHYTALKLNKLKLLKKSHLEKITEFCFDIMINDHQIAPKAYCMSSLEKLGNEFKWIHPELKIIIERDYASQSKGYQARARKVLDLMTK